MFSRLRLAVDRRLFHFKDPQGLRVRNLLPGLSGCCIIWSFVYPGLRLLFSLRFGRSWAVLSGTSFVPSDTLPLIKSSLTSGIIETGDADRDSFPVRAAVPTR